MYTGVNIILLPKEKKPEHIPHLVTSSPFFSHVRPWGTKGVRVSKRKQEAEAGGGGPVSANRPG